MLLVHAALKLKAAFQNVVFTGGRWGIMQLLKRVV